MGLTTAQLQTLKTSIAADATLNAMPNNADTATFIAGEYNKNAAPNWTVWKTNVSITQVGDAFNGAELEQLTALENDRLQTNAAYSAGGVNPSLPDRRVFYEGVFDTHNNTLANLAALWRRLATRAEKLYTTGTGSVASPATLTYEGPISYQDVLQARALP